jgi:DNA-binding phage protein
MKKLNNEDFELTAANVKMTGEDFSDYYAKYLKGNPKKLEHYKKYITQAYNRTKDMPLFLEGLKIVAKAETKITKLAKAAKVERTSIYRILSKEHTPTVSNLLAIANNLGIGFNAYVMK